VSGLAINIASDEVGGLRRRRPKSSSGGVGDLERIAKHALLAILVDVLGEAAWSKRDIDSAVRAAGERYR
jgi:hypothetical protein